MPRRFFAALPFCLATSLLAQDPAEQAEAAEAFGLDSPPEIEVVGDDAQKTVAQLAARLRPSLVVITQGGRAGGTDGTGTGFVISKDGLIATCAHVVGESRPLTVRFDDETEHEVTAIHALDIKHDIAVLRIEADDLQPIPLAQPESLEQGAEIVAMGNPHGLEFSVVHGVVSALRVIEETPFIQIAIPIEPGNSGGPLLDKTGHAHGLLAMKSTVSDNLGFAVPVDDLHRLLEKPNTVPMDKWLTIGQLDPKRWKAIMGARWKQRAGRISVTEQGAGFGGRSLCIYQRELPEPPYEVAVEVKLDDESGAAGLAFESNGDDKHYGFYPSSGNLRFTRFGGPGVESWSILDQIETKAYRPGEWNRIRVRVEAEKITGWVNGEKVVERNDGVLRGGRVGLAKFRQTEPEFRRFRLGENLAEDAAPAELLAQVEAHIATLQKTPDDADALDGLAGSPGLARVLLERKAKQLRADADALVAQSDTVHRRATEKAITDALDAGGDDSLLRAALLLSKLDNPELDIDAYLEEIERMAGEISATLAEDATAEQRVDAVRSYLFRDNGYHGSRGSYYSRSNSYLNEVIDDREGIPITLSVLFVELGRRAGAELHGLPLPGHFVAFYEKDGKRQLIDPFDGAVPLSDDQAEAIIAASGFVGGAADFPPAEPRGIVQRMLNNVKAIAIAEKDYPGAIRYVDVLLSLDPDDAQERLSRALLHVQTGARERAKTDLDWLFERKPEGIYLDRLRELYDSL